MAFGWRVLKIALGAVLLSSACCAPVGAANWFEKNLYLTGPRYESADRKSTRLNSSHMSESRMPSSA